MDYEVKPMERKAAREISTWKYPPPYAIYNIEDSRSAMAEMLNGTFFAVYENKGLVGFFCYGKAARIPWAEENGYYAPRFTDIGLAMHPELTGRGLGLEFFATGVEYAQASFPSRPVRLTVAAFNERARKVYLRAGFKEVGGFFVPGGLEFMIMVESAPTDMWEG